jgi:hypothetical protein
VRLQVRKFVCRLRCQIEKAFIDTNIEAVLLIGCKPMSDALSEILRDLGLEEHVLLGSPKKWKISHHGPLRIVVRLQRMR